MFKIFNPDTEKVELVAKIDYKKHYHVSGKPFDTTEVEDIVVATTIEEVLQLEEIPKKKGRPQAN